MKIYLPARKDKILKMPLFCRVNPLKRPRINKHRNGIYQPKDNQLELMNELQYYKEKHIATPVFVDCWIQINSCKEFELSYHAIDKQFGDIDNLIKAIYDGLVHWRILQDDRYIVGGDIRKSLGQEDFCYVIIWSAEHGVAEINV